MTPPPPPAAAARRINDINRPKNKMVGTTPIRTVTNSDWPLVSGVALTTVFLLRSRERIWSSAKAGRWVLKCVSEVFALAG
jgi:hypothetical protein